MTQFTMIDLFSGIGGMRIGFATQGVNCVYSSEINRYARQMYGSYFGKEPENTDIRDLNPDDIPSFDILTAGFPCQSFSTISFAKIKMDGFNDTRSGNRGSLFFEVIRVLKKRRPRAFLLENVKNLLRHDDGQTWKVVYQSLKKLGYKVFHKVLNAKDYGIPQNRQRVFIVGFRNHSHFSFPATVPLEIYIEDILEETPNPKHDLSLLMRTRMEKIYMRDKPKSAHQLMYDHYNRLWKLKGIAKTVRTNEGCSTAGTLLYPQLRRLTPRECLRLQGFPDDYPIPLSSTQAYARAGNSVPAPVVSRIAKQMIVTLNGGKANN